MNGTNSNTKGSEVANVGFWPAQILPRIQAALNNILTSLKRLQSGELLPASVDFSTKGDNDDIPDKTFSEIARRLIVTFENPQPGAVIFSPTPPDDHTKGWWQTDPITNLPTGSLMRWDEESGKWVPVDPSGVYVPPLKRSFTLVSPPGASTVNGAFTDIKTTDYVVNITPTTYANGAWAPPVAFPNGFGYVIVNKNSNALSVAFYGIPTGGLVWEVDIQARK